MCVRLHALTVVVDHHALSRHLPVCLMFTASFPQVIVVPPALGRVSAMSAILAGRRRRLGLRRAGTSFWMDAAHAHCANSLA